MKPPIRTSLAEAALRRLIALFPKDFRRSFGREVASTIQRRSRDLAPASRTARALFYIKETADLLRTALREWVRRLAGSRTVRGETSPDGAALPPRFPSKEPEMMKGLIADVRFAVRVLGRSPVSTGVALITLALGIGANAALFSVVDAVLLRPLPYRDSERLAMIWSRWKDFDKTWVSVPEYRYYLQEARSFEDIALFGTGNANLSGPRGAERVTGAMVTSNTFEVLGVKPLLGRAFTEEEAKQRAPLVVLSYGLWQSLFGGEESVLGAGIELDGDPYTVVGVMPAGFRLPIDFQSGSPSQVWGPFFVDRQGPVQIPRQGGNHGLHAVARLAPGATVEQAAAEMRGLAQRLTEQGIYTQAWNFTPLVIPVDEEILGQIRPALGVLLGAVGFVLLIACANVANLLLARGRGRFREIAVRSALGASRRRLTRQLMTESVMLSLGGGTLGLLIAWAGVRALPSLTPEGLPRLDSVGLDLTVLGFTFIVSVLTAFVFGLLPIVQASRINLVDSLREAGRSDASLGRGRFQRALTAVQAGLAVVLLLGSGLMLRTFLNLTAIDPGFKAENVLTLRLNLPRASYPEGEDVVSFYGRLLDRVRALPGVEAAGGARLLPLASEIGDSGVLVENYRPEDGTNPVGDWQIATTGYFEAMGIPIVQGRPFGESDDLGSEHVIIVNQTMASAYWPNGQALGQRVKVWGRGDDTPWMTVVGIAGDLRHNGITARVKPKWYRPQAQFVIASTDVVREMSLAIRTQGNPRALIEPVRGHLQALDASLPMAEVQTMSDVLS